MAHLQAPASGSSFGTRLGSALLLAPVALIAVWLGGAALAALAVAGVLALSWEWVRLTAGGWGWWGPRVMTGAALVAVLAAALGGYAAAVALIAAAAALLALSAVRHGDLRLGWLALGLPYVGLPCLALLWLRHEPPAGLATVVWVLALVWAVDTAAYFAGRGIGGPKLAPRISPGKTWAGFLGGIAAAVAVGGVTAAVLAVPILRLCLVSAVLAIVEQAGDLMESALKRHFKVKDSGSIIPGHGGMMDRVDGLIVTVVAVAALALGSGRSPLAWP
jgi:phosphatidate cytidylyltransferase